MIFSKEHDKLTASSKSGVEVAPNGVKTKVLFVVTKSNFGGAQRYCFDLATNLPEEFEPVVAFGPAPDGSPGRLARMLGEKEIRTIFVPELSRDMDAQSDLSAFMSLVRLIRREQPDVVHLNSSKAGGLGALAARIARVPRIVFTVHGLPSDESRSLVQKILIIGATWLTCIFAHRTITVTSANYTRLRAQPFLFKRVVLIHTGIRTPDFEAPAEARKSLRSIDPTIPSDILVGTIAELHPNKDLMTAIEAVAAVEGAHLVILGDGEERVRLEARAKEIMPARAHFLGYVPDAAKYLRAFDAFLLSSVKEGLPYVLLEAGAAHVPVVATDIPGVQDVILHNFTGLHAPARKASSLADALHTITSDSTLAEALSEELAKRLRESFSFDVMVKNTTRLYVR